MKTMIAVALLLISSTSFAQEDLIIKKGQVGGMIIGKSVYDGLTPADDVRVGKEENVIEIYRVGKLMVRLEVKVEMFATMEYMIKTITVFDQKFKTALGVGVGSSFADIRAKYADAQMEKTADDRRVATVGELSTYFWVGQAKSPTRSLMVLGRDIDFVEYSDQDLKVTSITAF